MSLEARTNGPAPLRRVENALSKHKIPYTERERFSLLYGMGIGLIDQFGYNDPISPSDQTVRDPSSTGVGEIQASLLAITKPASADLTHGHILIGHPDFPQGMSHEMLLVGSDGNAAIIRRKRGYMPTEDTFFFERPANTEDAVKWQSEINALADAFMNAA